MQKDLQLAEEFISDVKAIFSLNTQGIIPLRGDLNKKGKTINTLLKEHFEDCLKLDFVVHMTTILYSDWICKTILADNESKRSHSI